MQKRQIETAHSDYDTSARSRAVQNEPECRLRVELFLGGISLPGLIEYDATNDHMTFTVTRFSHVMVPEA